MSEVITIDGAAVKALGNGKVGGLLVRYSTADDPDLVGDYFTKDTDFDFVDGDKTSVLYHHGLDKKIGKRVIGKGTLTHTDLGVWVEAQLNLRDEYEQSIYELAEAGKLGWSSGTASHRLERVPVEGKEASWIASWALGLDASLTPTPCEPRTRAMTLKALADATTGTLDASKGTPVEGSPEEEAIGQTLSEHTAQILADLQVYADRIMSFVDMKKSDGRQVSKARKDAFKAVADRLALVLDRCQPQPDPQVVAMKLRLMRERLKTS